MPESKEIAKLVDLITSSGDGQELDASLLRTIKGHLKKDPTNSLIETVYALVLQRLRIDHAGVRRLGFMLMMQLFVRSMRFRELVCQDLTLIVELCIAPRGSLPPPRQAASALRERALDCLEEWSHKYGEALPQLTLAYSYLKRVLNLPFPQLRQVELARRQQLEQSRRDKYREAHTTAPLILQRSAELMSELEAAVEAVVPSFQQGAAAEHAAQPLLPFVGDIEVQVETPQMPNTAKAAMWQLTEQLQQEILPQLEELMHVATRAQEQDPELEAERTHFVQAVCRVHTSALSLASKSSQLSMPDHLHASPDDDPFEEDGVQMVVVSDELQLEAPAPAEVAAPTGRAWMKRPPPTVKERLRNKVMRSFAKASAARGDCEERERSMQRDPNTWSNT